MPKKVFSVENWKSENHHGILHILISLVSKCQLKLIILSFWTKFTQKKVFPVENRTSSQTTTFAFYVVNVNSTVVFKHSECLKDLIILKILK